MAHGFSHLTARKRVRVTTGGGGFKQPRRGKPNRPAPTPDPSKGRGTQNPKRTPTNPGPKGTPKPGSRRAAISHILARRKRLGKPINRAQARVALKRNIRSDKRHAAYKYDFAGDGAGRKDKDYGTKRWKKSMKRHGWTERGNHRNHAGGNGNRGDRTNSSDDPGNSQSGDSYGGPQSLSAAERKSQLQANRDKRKKRNRRRRNHSGNSG